MNFCKNRHNILNKDCERNNEDATTRKGQNFRDKKKQKNKQEVGGRVDGLWP